MAPLGLGAEARGWGGEEERIVGEGVESGLVAIEEGGVVAGTVVVDLAPVVVEEAEDARGAKREIESGGGGFEVGAFVAHGVKSFAGNVERIIVELGGDTRGTEKKFFVDATDFGPAPFGAAEGIVHGDVVGGGPVLAHEDDVSGVKGAIKLRERVTWMREIAKIFVAGDGIERGGESG